VNNKFYSNTEFNEIKKRINKEILRRGTYSWWDPLSDPKVGEDKSSPLNIPDNDIFVNDKTYTINTPSEGSIERTRNIKRLVHGDSPGGTPGFVSSVPNTSAARFDLDEIKNYLVGLSKINDINLFYGREEKSGTVFRNPQGIEDLLNKAENNTLHETIPMIFDIILNEDGELIVSYNGDQAPNIVLEDGNIILTYEAGDKYEIVSTISFEIKDANLYVNDIKNLMYRKDDPNHGNISYMQDRGATSEYISTVKFSSDGYEAFMENTHCQRFPFRFSPSINKDGNLMITTEDYVSSDIRVDEDGNILMTLNDYEEYWIRPSIDDELLYVMNSGEYEGEELYNGELGPSNFFDDYGAAKGDGDYHPYNKASIPVTIRNMEFQDNDRRVMTQIYIHGGIKAASYGQNPRNPVQGKEYPSRPIFRGTPGSCDGQCTGLCFTTCDDMCSESCSSTCFSRCGNGCTSSCGNVCTGCTTLCYSSCRTKCENSAGYSCVKAGAKTVKISSIGGKNGIPAVNKIESTNYTCNGCSYSCQFYPNKKTECWDAACMGKCFNTCTYSCSDSCSGGCIDNSSENSSYKVGKGRGCSAGCTINCIGSCQGVCEGQCVETCFSGCKQLCTDNCEWICSTNCGSGCATGCTKGCTGCDTTCEGLCLGTNYSRVCVGCSSSGGCASNCKFDCSTNCVGFGCNSLCGTETAGSCDYNCRIGCNGSSCTSLCEDQCYVQCSTCVNTCGWQCGACSNICSTGCESDCDITCTATCEHSCESNCLQSCSKVCGGCSNLCYSCTGMCIGLCSLKCENGCSSCNTMCGWWCDTACSTRCFSLCDNMCLNSCSTSCVTFVTSETSNTRGPEKKPTAEGYKIPDPKNRIEEQESFIIRREDNNGKDN
jgi:hypothetical protein